MIAIESKTAPYFASIQINWAEGMTHADIHVIPLQSSKEDKDDDQFFEQVPPQDNRELMVKFWEGFKKTYKLVKITQEEKSSPH